jgi:hypothetical protein
MGVRRDGDIQDQFSRERPGDQRRAAAGRGGEQRTCHVVAFIENPAARSAGTDSWAWAEVTGPDATGAQVILNGERNA